MNTSIYLPHLDHFLDVNCAGTVPVVKLERPVQFVPEWSVFGSWECSIFQIKRSLAQNWMNDIANFEGLHRSQCSLNAISTKNSHLGVALVIQWAAIRNSQKSRQPLSSFTMLNRRQNTKKTHEKKTKNGIGREDYFLSGHLIKGWEDNTCNAGSVVGHIWEQAGHHCLNLSI